MNKKSIKQRFLELGWVEVVSSGGVSYYTEPDPEWRGREGKVISFNNYSQTVDFEVYGRHDDMYLDMNLLGLIVEQAKELWGEQCIPS